LKCRSFVLAIITVAPMAIKTTASLSRLKIKFDAILHFLGQLMKLIQSILKKMILKRKITLFSYCKFYAYPIEM
jgi:hypothetical protein